MSWFSWDFWFATYPMRLAASSERGLFVLFCAVALAAIIARLWARQEGITSRVRREVFAFSSWFFLLSILGFGWLFMTAEEVQFFGMRGWFLVWCGAVAYLLYRGWRFAYVELPALQARNRAAAVADVYQPRRAR